MKSPGYKTTPVETGYPSRIYSAWFRSRGLQPPAGWNKPEREIEISSPPGDFIAGLQNDAR
ncbi:MAG: hypothetical protein HUU38_25580 [Anaerolineales bacterium]|nr:hypothetical protein [Anaerolineales bacterium]